LLRSFCDSTSPSREAKDECSLDDWSTLVRLLESDFAVAVERRGDEVFLRRREK